MTLHIGNLAPGLSSKEIIREITLISMESYHQNIHQEVEDHQGEGPLEEDPLEEEDHQEVEDPQEEAIQVEDHLEVEDHQEEDHLEVEAHLEEDPQEEDTLGPKGIHLQEEFLLIMEALEEAHPEAQEALEEDHLINPQTLEDLLD